MPLTKLQLLKDALTNPPAERIAKVEYQSHLLNILGNLLVSAILIYKGYWYIILAFIFSVGVSYSQAVQSFQKYQMIKETNSVLSSVEVFDQSPTRRAKRVIVEQLGKWTSTLIALISVVLGYLLFKQITTTWYGKLSFAFLLMFIYAVLYYVLAYNLAKFIKRSNVKGGN